MLAQNLVITIGALAWEAFFGNPSLFNRIGHPVQWIGALIGWADRQLNRPPRRRNGVLTVGLLLLAVLPAIVLQIVLFRLLPPLLAVAALAALASPLLAQRSLYRHVTDVADALEEGGLEAGRAAVAHIVGRNPASLDEAGVVRAAIESLAENFSDAVVAPACFGVLFGLPGMVFYKAVNTADSMIGHRSERYHEFGWAAARLDDLLNLVPARLSSLLLVCAAVLPPRADVSAALRAMRSDAPRHRSPNAGWPEAAMAGALGLRLAGPRVYGTLQIDDAWMGQGRSDATPADLAAALVLYKRACVIYGVLLLALSVLIG
jgi:adenosylcobinamide-phosphate synthase